MLNKIIIYIQSHPIIVSLLIIILFVIMFYLSSYTEYMDSVSTDSDKIFYSNFISQSGTNLLNFKCKVEDKEYYLASVPSLSCVENENSLECSTIKMILVETQDADLLINDYIKSVKLNSDICNKTNQIKCEATKEVKSECENKYDECEAVRQYVTDFKVKVVMDSNPRKYYITGVSKPYLNGSSTPSILNNHLYYTKNINYLCGDMSDSKDSTFTQIRIVEKEIQNTGGIIGNTSTIKVKLQMDTAQLVSRTATIIDTNTKAESTRTIITPLIDQSKGTPKLKQTYIGICEGKTCMLNGKAYPRICLYDDSSNNNVLEFEPIIISNNGGKI